MSSILQLASSDLERCLGYFARASLRGRDEKRPTETFKRNATRDQRIRGQCIWAARRWEGHFLPFIRFSTELFCSKSIKNMMGGQTIEELKGCALEWKNVH